MTAHKIISGIFLEEPEHFDEASREWISNAAKMIGREIENRIFSGMEDQTTENFTRETRSSSSLTYDTLKELIGSMRPPLGLLFINPQTEYLLCIEAGPETASEVSFRQQAYEVMPDQVEDCIAISDRGLAHDYKFGGITEAHLMIMKITKAKTIVRAFMISDQDLNELWKGGFHDCC